MHEVIEQIFVDNFQVGRKDHPNLSNRNKPEIKNSNPQILLFEKH